jgi:TRAP-type C4-dicarboxylate transport system permease small subunit
MRAVAYREAGPIDRPDSLLDKEFTDPVASGTMDLVQRLCMIVAGACVIAITLIIPWGIFSRYVLGIGLSWAEPVAVLLVIWFAFTSAAVCYREGLHIGVAIVPNLLQGTVKTAIGWTIELYMAGLNLFMLVWGIRLVATTWNQTIAAFPIVSTGMSYLPVPIGGAVVVLFVIERLWTGRLFVEHRWTWSSPPKGPTTPAHSATRRSLAQKGKMRPEEDIDMTWPHQNAIPTVQISVARASAFRRAHSRFLLMLIAITERRGRAI